MVTATLEYGVDRRRNTSTAFPTRSDPMHPPPASYRPAVRGLVCGLVAIGVHAATMGLLWFLAMSLGQPGAKASATWDVAWYAVPAMSGIANIIALVGVGYAAIAAHRRERGPILVFAFVASVTAALIDVRPFLFASL